MKASASIVLLLLAACGDDDGGTARRDAAVMIDGRLVDASTIDTPMIDAGIDAQQFVQTVACTSGEPTITTTDGAFSYSPTTQTINQNEVVKFVMSGTHNVVPNSTGSDPGVSVPFGQTRCLKFTTTGTFGFHCGPHSFTGSITVQ